MTNLASQIDSKPEASTKRLFGLISNKSEQVSFVMTRESTAQPQQKRNPLLDKEVSMEVTMPFGVREQIKLLAALEGKPAHKYAEEIIVNHVQLNEHRLKDASALVGKDNYKRPYRTPLQKLLEKNKQLRQENQRLHAESSPRR